MSFFKMLVVLSFSSIPPHLTRQMLCVEKYKDGNGSAQVLAVVLFVRTANVADINGCNELGGASAIRMLLTALMGKLWFSDCWRWMSFPLWLSRVNVI